MDLDAELARRLREHGAEIGRTPADLVAELVRDYLDSTGPYAEISTHLGTINRIGRQLEAHAKAARALVDDLPRFARTYDKGDELARRARVG